MPSATIHVRILHLVVEPTPKAAGLSSAEARNPFSEYSSRTTMRQYGTPGRSEGSLTSTVIAMLSSSWMSVTSPNVTVSENPGPRLLADEAVQQKIASGLESGNREEQQARCAQEAAKQQASRADRMRQSSTVHARTSNRWPAHRSRPHREPIESLTA
jgi:hypothetical protein